MNLSIKAENFRSFTSLDWTLPDGLTLIDGKNNDTGGSNASGKSNLLNAWAWARYGWLPKWGGPKGGQADAVIKRGAKQCWVEVTEKLGSDELTIRRERPNKLTVWKNGEELKSMDQKGLEELVGSPEKFFLSVYIPQKRQSSFFHLGDKERTELLSVMAGLEKLDAAHQKAKDQRDHFKLEIEKSTLLNDYLEKELSALPAKLLDATTTALELESKVKSTQKEFAGSQGDHQKKAADLKEELDYKIRFARDTAKELAIETQVQDIKSQIQTPKDYEPELDLAVGSAKVELQSAQVQEMRAKKTKSDNANLKAKIEELLAQAQKVSEGECNACGQILPEAQRVAKAQEYLLEVSTLQSGIVPEIEYAVPLDLYVKLEAAQQARQFRIAELAARPNELKSQIKKLEAELIALKAQAGAKIYEARHSYDQEINRLDRIEASLKQSYNLAQQEHSQALKAQKLIEDQLAKTQLELKALKDQAVMNQKSLDLAIDLVELFGPKGFRAVCYDGLVDRISDRAAQLLSAMTDGVYTTRLDQIKTDSKGNQKLVLEPKIFRDSTEVPIDDLSGGYEDRAALAYDVAIAELAAEGLPLLLDEVLTALDAQGKTEAMTLLEELAKTRPVLIIDHSSEFKASFSKVVTVEFTHGESSII